MNDIIEVTQEQLPLEPVNTMPPLVQTVVQTADETGENDTPVV